MSDDTRVLRSTEKGLVLDVTILNEDDSPYDLTGKNLSFSEIKESDRVVADDGTGEQSGKFTMIDQTKGHFSYQMTHQCYTASGTCFFQIKQDDTIVDTTQDFYFKVKVDPTVKPINDSYVSSLIAMENHLLGATQKTQAAIDQLSKDSSDAQQQAQAILTKINSDFTDYSNKYNKLSSDWQAQAKAINDAATKQLADLKTSNQADIEAAVKSINDQRDAALKQLNDEKTQELADIQSDYNSWKTTTVKDFNDTVQPIKDSISANDQKLTTVSKQVSDAVTSMDSLKQQFDKVDFSKFVTGDTIKNYYTKEETDLRLAQAGKVKTVDGNSPDSNGNVVSKAVIYCDSPQAAYDASTKDKFHLYAYDMNNEATEGYVAGQRVTIETLHNDIQTLQSQMSSKANTSDLANLGKVKTVNGNQPDGNGNVNVPAPDLSGYATKADLATAGKLKTVSINGGTKIQPDSAGNADLTIDLSSKANESEVNNLTNRVTTIETGYMKKPTVISKADYDKLSTKDPNTLYEITE